MASRVPFALVGLVACGARAPLDSASPNDAIHAEGAHATPDGRAENTPWFATESRSPRELAPRAGSVGALFRHCTAGDEALAVTAEELAERVTAEPAVLEPSAVALALRARGSPYVWPRVFSLAGGRIEANDLEERVQSWLASSSGAGERRCGFGAAKDGRAVVGLAVHALADLSPLPTRTRVGGWLEVRAELLVPARGVKVLALGPRGAPRSLPTSLDGRRALARFSADASGEWRVQVLADVEGGPQAVLEAVVFAGVAPPRELDATPAPGEEAGRGLADPAAALERMVAAARRFENKTELRRVSSLDRIAQRHAEAMRGRGRLAHDVGQGGPAERIEAAGLAVRAVGENVAHALGPARVHRTIWTSPAHRAALLNPQFDALGLGVAEDKDGMLWVCELFATLAR